MRIVHVLDELVLILSGGGLAPALLLVMAYASRDRSIQLQVFCRSVASILRQNLPLPRGLAVLAGDTSCFFASRLRRIQQRLEAGAPLARALEEFPSAFPVPFTRAVGAAERTGTLAPVVDDLASALAIHTDMVSQVYLVVAYLIFVVCSSLFVMTRIYVLPSFEKVMSDLRMDWEPAFFLQTLQASLSTVAALLGFLLLCLPVFLRVADGRVARNLGWVRVPFDVVVRATPFVWGVTLRAGTVRFCRLLALLLRGGVPMREAMNLATGLEAQFFLAHRFDALRRHWEAGMPLGQAARSAGLPLSLVWILEVGERNGDLPDLLERSSASLEEDIRSWVERQRRTLFPLIVMFAGIAVGSQALMIFGYLNNLVRSMA